MPKTLKKPFWLWIVLIAVLPPIGFILFGYLLFKAAIEGRPPSGVQFSLWLLALFSFGSIQWIPFGELSQISTLLYDKSYAVFLLQASAIIDSIMILILIASCRKEGRLNHYFPLKRIEFGIVTLPAFLLCLTPLLTLFFNSDSVLVNPFQIAFSTVCKEGAGISILLGAVTIGITGPIMEEMIFRGILEGEAMSNLDTARFRLVYAVLASLLFASMHPYFLIPFILSMLFFFIRKETQNILNPILMHIVWNSSIVLVMLIQFKSE